MIKKSIRCPQERSFLNFEYKGKSESGKTDRYTVFNVSTGIVLGHIHWYAPWRKYIFETIEKRILLDHACMEEIVDFLHKITSERSEREQTTERGSAEQS